MKKIVSILLIICSVHAAVAFAQKDNDAAKAEKARKTEIKKQLADAKNNLKQNTNLDKTEAAMTKLLSDSLNIRDKRLHVILLEALRKQYQQGNEKMYLKQKVDTVSIVMTARKLFLAAQRLDSVESIPDAKGRVETSSRKDNAEMLSQIYGNLYRGGIIMLNSQKYREALECMDTYISAPSWPVADGMLAVDSARYRHASYVSLVAGSKAGDYDAALKYEKSALEYSPRLETSLQYLADIYGERKDTARYVAYLIEGVDSFPKSQYFYPRLVDYYSDHGKYEMALDVTNRVIEADSTNTLARIARQTLLLNLSRYDECISEGEALLAIDDSLAEVDYNVALAYYNQAMVVESSTDLKRREKTKKANALYRKCRPYMEKYRALKPEDKDKWRPVLYNVYLNLNMGEEFNSLSPRSLP